MNSWTVCRLSIITFHQHIKSLDIDVTKCRTIDFYGQIRFSPMIFDL